MATYICSPRLASRLSLPSAHFVAGTAGALLSGASGIAVFLYLLPWLAPRSRENVRVDDTGVIVATNKGQDEVHWDEVTRVRIITTSAGPWSEDVFFVLEGTAGKGCVVPHDAAVRTQLLQEMQVRLSGIDDRIKVQLLQGTATKEHSRAPDRVSQRFKSQRRRASSSG